MLTVTCPSTPRTPTSVVPCTTKVACGHDTDVDDGIVVSHRSLSYKCIRYHTNIPETHKRRVNEITVGAIYISDI
jgi:hypothetical protein